MFGIFRKKKAAPTISEPAASEPTRLPEAPERRQLREEFEGHVGKLRNGPEAARSAAGHGIRMANDFFMQANGSVPAFVERPKQEQIDFIDKLIGMAEKLEKVDGQTALGITLFRLWLVALAAGDDELMDSFAVELAYLTGSAGGKS